MCKLNLQPLEDFLNNEVDLEELLEVLDKIEMQYAMAAIMFTDEVDDGSAADNIFMLHSLRKALQGKPVLVDN